VLYRLSSLQGGYIVGGGWVVVDHRAFFGDGAISCLLCCVCDYHEFYMSDDARYIGPCDCVVCCF
jgi:hypothetical protein